MLTTGSIEERIFQRQIAKMSLSDSIVDEKEGSSSNGFSAKELKNLFSLDETTECLTTDLLRSKSKKNEDGIRDGLVELLHWDAVHRHDDDNDDLKENEGGVVGGVTDRVLRSVWNSPGCSITCVLSKSTNA